MPPRKNLAERYPCGKLKKNHESSLPLTVWKRGKEAIANFQLDPRFGTELGKHWLAGDLTDAEASAADEVARIYGRYEKLHCKRRSVASPSYGMGWSGSTGLADERMTPGQSKARSKREQSIEAAFMALRDEMASEPRDVRDALEQLCVEDRPVPGWLLPKIRKVLQRLAREWRIVDRPEKQPIESKQSKSLAYKSSEYIDPSCVTLAVEIVNPLAVDERACRLLVLWTISMCRRMKADLLPAHSAAEEELGTAIQLMQATEKALLELRRIYKRLAFQGRDDYDDATIPAIRELRRVREPLQTTLDAYRSWRIPRPRGGKRADVSKRAAAAYAYCILVVYSEKPPTLTVPGAFLELASVIYEGATAEREIDFFHHCRTELERRRAWPQPELRRCIREAEAQIAAEITELK